MTPRAAAMRTFERRGELLVDFAAKRTESGGFASHQLPVEMMGSLRWSGWSERSAPAATPDANDDADEARRDRLRSAAPGALESEDLLAVAWRGDVEGARIIAARFDDILANAGDDAPSQIIDAAFAILAVDSAHLAAASRLGELLLSARTTNVMRRRVADVIGDVHRPMRHTAALQRLEDAMKQLVEEPEHAACWPFMYGCVKPLLGLARHATLARCDAELSQRDEWTRSLLLNELAEVAGPDIVALLRKHHAREPSVRLRLKTMRCLGDLLPERQRRAVLVAALRDASPSCRYLALRALRSVPPQAARDLAERALRDEPDPHLATLLAEAAQIASACTV